MADRRQEAVNGFAHLKVFCGASTIAHYVDRANAPLVCGDQRLSYVDIAQRTGLPAGRTARLISEAAAGHRAKSLRDLYDKSSPSSLAVHGFGSGSILMLFRLWEFEGLDVNAWAKQGDHWRDGFTTWVTYKKREQDADTRTHKQPAGGPREKGYRKRALREQKRADRKAGIS